AGKAKLRTTLTVGRHNVKATYAGDAKFRTSTSPVLALTVKPKSKTDIQPGRSFDPNGDVVPNNDGPAPKDKIRKIEESPEVARLPDGAFVLAWQSSDDAGNSIHLRRFKNEGEPAGGDVIVTRSASKSLTQPRLIALSEGGYVVAWNESEA